MRRQVMEQDREDEPDPRNRGIVRCPAARVPNLLPDRPTPERCVEANYLQRSRFESIAARKLRRRQLSATRYCTPDPRLA